MVTISDQLWGTHEDKEVRLFRMENCSSGAFVELSSYGATLVSIVVPDRNGDPGNVILGYPNLHGYLFDEAYLGSTVGRFANRIANAAFVLDGDRYQLEANDHRNSNHSGSSGFHHKVFDAEVSGDKLTFSLLSPDGDGGFPGNLSLKVSYQWTETNRLLMSYVASTDRETIVNLTNHAYFNLSASPGKIFDHELTIYADNILEAGVDYIPTGKVIPAGDLSFRKNLIRERMTMGDKIGGLNTCYLLDDDKRDVSPAAVLSDPVSGRVMEVYTSYPGLMLYTGDFLNSAYPGHFGLRYEPFDGLCLECQYYPDSPNHAGFPSVRLNPGEIYRHSIAFQFNNTIENISHYEA